MLNRASGRVWCARGYAPDTPNNGGKPFPQVSVPMHLFQGKRKRTLVRIYTLLTFKIEIWKSMFVRVRSATFLEGCRDQCFRQTPCYCPVDRRKQYWSDQKWCGRS